MPEVVQLIDDYADTIHAPVRTGTTVTRVRAIEDGYEVATDAGVWRCTTLVLASGAANRGTIPPFAEEVPSSVATLAYTRTGTGRPLTWLRTASAEIPAGQGPASCSRSRVVPPMSDAWANLDGDSPMSSAGARPSNADNAWFTR